MSASDLTVTGNVLQALGLPYANASGHVWLTFNTENGRVTDDEGNVRIGAGAATLSSDGSFSMTGIPKPGTSNPTSFQCKIHYDVRPVLAASRGVKRETGDFGWMTITVDADLADLEDEQAIPPNYQTTFTDAMDEIADAAAASADAAAASAAEAAAIIVTDLGTTDAQTAFLIENPSDTQDALTASFAQTINVAPTASHGIGSGDDTAFLQAKLDQVSVALGLTHVILRGGHWMIDGVNHSQSNASIAGRGGGLVPKAGTTLILDEGATLEVIANSSPGYAAISLDDGQDDVKIIGGTILGDRATHSYVSAPPYSTHEFGYGIYIRGVENVEVRGVNISGCTGDSVFLAPVGLDDVLPDYVPAKQITIRDCTLDGARRNNISVTGADQVLIENCRITNAGLNDGIHDGTAPKCGIDLEYSTSQAVTNITIRNNVFTGNVTSSVNVFNAWGVVVEGNFSDNRIALGNNPKRVKILDNIVYRSTVDVTGALAGIFQSSAAADTQIDGNWVSGFATGIQVSSPTTEVRNNRVENFVDYGIVAYQADRPVVANNTVVGDKASTIQAGIRLSGCTDPDIKGNKIDGCYYGIRANTLVSVGVYFITGNTFTDCFDSVRVSTGGCTLLIARNTFRPGGHGSGVGNDVAYPTSASVASNVLATHNEHIGSGVAYLGAGTSTTYSRIIDNTLTDVTAVNAMSLSGTSSKHIVLRNTIVSNRPSGSAGEAISIVSAVGSVVIGNIVYSIGAVAFTRLVNSASATSTTIRGNHFDGATIATSQAADIVDGNFQIGAAAAPGLGTVLLSTVTSINAKTTGTTDLYTVPTGKSAVITGAIIRATVASSVSAPPTLGIGVAAGEDDIFGSTALTGFDSTSEIWRFVPASGLSTKQAAASVIKLGIDTASTGTAHTIAVDLLGYLV